MTMLERAAKAAWENHRNGNHLFGGPPQDEDWSDLTVQQKAALCTLVAAVLRAIREPNPAMVAGYNGALKKYIETLPMEERTKFQSVAAKGGYWIYNRNLKAVIRWHGTIDAILNEGASDG